MERIDFLDGLRGAAAFWVLVGHATLLTGLSLPIIDRPDYGVDLFILLSGFLMTWQYQMRRGVENWSSPRTWVGFWLRRFFRLAPLYYACLAVALLLGTLVFADRSLIDAFLHRQPQSAFRYEDVSVANVATHLSFTFGLFPQFAFRTALPDWSIGLEMQFYAVFPLFVMLVKRFGIIASAVVTALGAVLIAGFLHKIGVVYPMPAFLPLKWHVFLAGILTAGALDQGRKWLFCLLAAAFAALPIGAHHTITDILTREVIVIGFFGLVHTQTWPLTHLISRALSAPVMRWAGELSYSAYLLHLLIMQPIGAMVIGQLGSQISASERFAIVLTLVVLTVYPIAFLAFTFIEQPGREWGKRLISSLPLAKREAIETSAEGIAAP